MGKEGEPHLAPLPSKGGKISHWLSRFQAHHELTDPDESGRPRALVSPDWAFAV